MSNSSRRADRDRQDFSDVELVPMIFDSYQRYEVNGHLLGLDLLLKIAPYDTNPSFDKYLIRWGNGAQMTFNIPAVFSHEFVLMLQLLDGNKGFEKDVLTGFQEEVGVRFRKLILMPDEEEGAGGVIGHIHSMNPLGDDFYFKVSVESALFFALTHHNVPIYADEALFHSDHIRKRKREEAALLQRFGLSSGMTLLERVQTAIRTDIDPKEFELLASQAVLASELSPETLRDLIHFAIQNERYEWAHFITNILE